MISVKKRFHSYGEPSSGAQQRCATLAVAYHVKLPLSTALKFQIISTLNLVAVDLAWQKQHTQAREVERDGRKKNLTC